MIKKAKDLLPQERIELSRRRLGYTREDLARNLHVSESTVYNWETGKTTPEETVLANEEIIKTLHDYEICYITRKRLGLTQGQIAKGIGLSRYWVNMMEQGQKSPARLLKYLKENYG